MSLGPGTVVITVPGLRGHVDDHRQTRLAATMPNVRPVPPLGRDNPSLDDRVAAMQDAVAAAGEPVILASTDDALGDPVRVRALADAWGSTFRDIGPVGHLNPASGYGDWPGAERLLDELDSLGELAGR